MKNKCIHLVLFFMIAGISLFGMDSAVAAAEQNGEPSVSQEAEAVKGPAADAEPEAEAVCDPAADAEPEAEAVCDPAADAEPEAEAVCDPAAEVEPEAEACDDPVADAEPETYALSEREELVSSGQALIDWLESHKYTGGTVKLADHIVLDGDYSFYPGMTNMSDILVDTDRYTITVTGRIEISGDHHLLFAGQSNDKAVFYVAENGLLSMQGTAVDSDCYAAWQEEGAGLVITDCHISGSVHYADTPFIMYFRNDICAAVE